MSKSSKKKNVSDDEIPLTKKKKNSAPQKEENREEGNRLNNLFINTHELKNLIKTLPTTMLKKTTLLILKKIQWISKTLQKQMK